MLNEKEIEKKIILTSSKSAYVFNGLLRKILMSVFDFRFLLTFDQIEEIKYFPTNCLIYLTVGEPKKNPKYELSNLNYKLFSLINVLIIKTYINFSINYHILNSQKRNH